MKAKSVLSLEICLVILTNYVKYDHFAIAFD